MFFKKIFIQYSFILLCLVIILLRLPAVYILPIRNEFFNLHSLARYIILFLFITRIIFNKKAQKYLTVEKSAILFFIYFISQSVSVIHSLNITEFLIRYKDLFFILLFFCLFLLEVDTINKVDFLINLIFFCTILDFLYEIIVYFQLGQSFVFLKAVLGDNALHGLTSDINKNKYFINIYSSALIPLGFILIAETKKRRNIILILIIIFFVILFSLISNFRGQFIIAIIASFISILMLIFRRKNTRLIFFLIFSTLFFSLSISIFIKQFPTNAFNRIIDPSPEDYANIEGRVFYWRQSLDIGKSFPLFGVGLGNFYEYISKNTANVYVYNRFQNTLLDTWTHPHNIFFATYAETGLFGFFSLVVMLSYFLINDFNYFKSSSFKIKMLLISFWCLFSYSLIYPAVKISYGILFWSLRGLILKLRNFSKKKNTFYSFDNN